MCLQKVKFILNPVLPRCHLLGSLARFGLGEFAIVSPLGFDPNLVYFDRQLAVVGKPLPQTFNLVLKVSVGLAVELLMIFDKVYYNLLI